MSDRAKSPCWYVKPSLSLAGAPVPSAIFRWWNFVTTPARAGAVASHRKREKGVATFTVASWSVCGLRAHRRAHFPDLREKAPAERVPEVGDAERSAGARLHADHPLDHLHVAEAPQQHLLVEADEVLAEALQREV